MRGDYFDTANLQNNYSRCNERAKTVSARHNRFKGGGLARIRVLTKNNRACPSAKGARLFFRVFDDYDYQRD